MIERDANTVFYHGTDALAAVCIAIDGFRLHEKAIRSGGEIGDGVYLTSEVEVASFFAWQYGYILRARLASGTRILRLNRQFDQRVIDSLRREFGTGILRPAFDRAIPHNKRLRSEELFHLCNYLWSRNLMDYSREGVRRLRSYAARSHYHGLGEHDTANGIVIFNPSRVLLEGIGYWSPAPPGLIEADPARLLADAAQQFLSSVRITENCEVEEPGGDGFAFDEFDAAHARVLPRRQSCLRRFAALHGLATDAEDVARALAVDLTI